MINNKETGNFIKCVEIIKQRQSSDHVFDILEEELSEAQNLKEITLSKDQIHLLLISKQVMGETGLYHFVYGRLDTVSSMMRIYKPVRIGTDLHFVGVHVCV